MFIFNLKNIIVFVIECGSNDKLFCQFSMCQKNCVPSISGILLFDVVVINACKPSVFYILMKKMNKTPYFFFSLWIFYLK